MRKLNKNVWTPFHYTSINLKIHSINEVVYPWKQIYRFIKASWPSSKLKNFLQKLYFSENIKSNILTSYNPFCLGNLNQLIFPWKYMNCLGKFAWCALLKLNYYKNIIFWNFPPFSQNKYGLCLSLSHPALNLIYTLTYQKPLSSF